MNSENISVKISDQLLKDILDSKLFCDNPTAKAEIEELNNAGNIFAIKQMISTFANQGFINILIDISAKKIDTPEEFEELHSKFFKHYNNLLKRIDKELGIEPVEKLKTQNGNDEPTGPVNN